VRILHIFAYNFIYFTHRCVDVGLKKKQNLSTRRFYKSNRLSGFYFPMQRI